ncbi:hypothetical protein JQK88_10425 [Mesorhizobium caraganae]|uniref:hypothetical protein n=1 Tax=Mesorhizobium caraganae TaxID=483206 RepID=UPI001939EE5C|nr:hypothetical protein [Mesorhizobium caraganae]MBM2711661.1 hypothetical protein [Mesorhizobium caraganae]
MTLKMLTVSAMALAMITGSALAGSSTGTSALDDPAKMSPFFTDAGMKTMRSEADIQSAWMAMSEEDRNAVMKDCADATVAKSHADFCKMAMKMGK